MSSKLITIVLVMVCSLLFAILLWPGNDVNINLKRAVPSSPTAQNEPLGLLMPQTAYAAIVQKPLFSPSRTAAQFRSFKTEKDLSTVQRKKSSTPLLLPHLVGVLHFNGVDMAFIKGKNDLESTGLNVGDSYQGWELTSISGTEIVLRKNEVDEKLSLDWGSPGEGHTGESQFQSGNIHLKDRLAGQIEGSSDGGDGSAGNGDSEPATNDLYNKLDKRDNDE